MILSLEATRLNIGLKTKAMANMRYHMSVNIEGLLRNYKRRKINIFNNDDGTTMSDKKARAEIARLQALGHKLIGCGGECEGFDPFGGGCPGHEINEAK